MRRIRDIDDVVPMTVSALVQLINVDGQCPPALFCSQMVQLKSDMAKPSWSSLKQQNGKVKSPFFLVWGDFLTNPINTKYKVKSFLRKEVKAAVLTTCIMPVWVLHHT